ncbi:hypothetical protein MLD38_036807 [Melastoma candidum]|uniref:Uncharacterized protein n=1 Tax=Melastoma candidum TaxID=119954 RepID=A0ACB9LMP5_9MYRT|nr:hypothetical protein MLD38_036807 [Melastoma candidum]
MVRWVIEHDNRSGEGREVGVRSGEGNVVGGRRFWAWEELFGADPEPRWSRASSGGRGSEMVAARDVGCELFKSGESRGATSSSGKLVTAAVKSETAGGDGRAGSCWLRRCPGRLIHHCWILRTSGGCRWVEDRASGELIWGVSAGPGAPGRKERKEATLGYSLLSRGFWNLGRLKAAWILALGGIPAGGDGRRAGDDRKVTAEVLSLMLDLPWEELDAGEEPTFDCQGWKTFLLPSSWRYELLFEILGQQSRILYVVAFSLELPEAAANRAMVADPMTADADAGVASASSRTAVVAAASGGQRTAPNRHVGVPIVAVAGALARRCNGYEGRCGLPTNFDSTYCYALGYVVGALLQSGKTGLISSVGNLAAPVSEWTVGGTALTSLMDVERRHGKYKPVIKKAMVELDGAPFKKFASLREEWAVKNCYISPGPIQFVGPASDAVNHTLLLELGALA